MSALTHSSMNLKRLLMIAALTLCVTTQGVGCASGQPDFNNFYSDSTLRLDYIFSGAPGHESVALRAKSQTPSWFGRRSSLNRLPLAGNGEVTITTIPGDTIYRHSFSSLYQEWLETGDSTDRAFEHTVLVPAPLQPAVITLTLYDCHRNPIATHKMVHEPSDILLRRPTPVTHDTIMIHRGTYTGPRIAVAVIGEGYTGAQRDDFIGHARTAVDQILLHQPFTELADRFDFMAVFIPSNDEGVSVPAKGLWRDTPFRSHFSTFYSTRYLTTPDVFAVHDALNGLPYAHIIILANTDSYGGGGIYNSYTLTAAGHALFKPVVVHEFGHSFGGLADEYFYDDDVMTDTYPTDIEPWEPNVTTLHNFDAKWKRLLAPDTPIPTPVERSAEFTVGVYEGAAYSSHGIYRPADVCRMRVNDIDSFCPACIDALKRLIHFYTD